MAPSGIGAVHFLSVYSLMAALMYEDHFKTKLEEDACSFFATSEQRRKYGECIIMLGIARGDVITFQSKFRDGNFVSYMLFKDSRLN